MQTRYLHFGERHHHNHISLRPCKESDSFLYKHLDFGLCGPHQPYHFTHKWITLSSNYINYSYYNVCNNQSDCIRHKLDKVA